MSEPAPTQQSTAHEEIAAQIQAAASELPGHVVAVNEELEGVTRISGRPNGNGSGLGGNFVQHSQVDDGPDVVIGRLEVDQAAAGERFSGAAAYRAAPGNTNLGSYSFRSLEGQGVQEASARRLTMPYDTITRAGSDHYRGEGDKMPAKARVYDHKFKDEDKDRVGKLVTTIAIKQAARTK